MRSRNARRPPRWPMLLLAAPAGVAIWSGWVGLGEMAGFGMVRLLPGIADEVRVNSAITLPIGVEAYAAYALRVWLSGDVPARARRFARWSAIGSLVLGALGQITYHLLSAAGLTTAPWQITTLVACLPVVVLGMGAALVHLLHANSESELAPVAESPAAALVVTGTPHRGNETAAEASPGEAAELPPGGSTASRRDAVEIMRRHWDKERAAGRIPSGADLDRVAETRDYGRRLRRQWLDAERQNSATSAVNGRALLPPTADQETSR
jgi:hypothetical protein